MLSFFLFGWPSVIVYVTSWLNFFYAGPSAEVGRRLASFTVSTGPIKNALKLLPRTHCGRQLSWPAAASGRRLASFTVTNRPLIKNALNYYLEHVAEDSCHALLEQVGRRLSSFTVTNTLLDVGVLLSMLPEASSIHLRLGMISKFLSEDLFPSRIVT